MIRFNVAYMFFFQEGFKLKKIRRLSLLAKTPDQRLAHFLFEIRVYCWYYFDCFILSLKTLGLGSPNIT